MEEQQHTNTQMQEQAAAAAEPDAETKTDPHTSSVIELCGAHKAKCGYCRSEEKNSASYGVVARRLTCEDYQLLIDRGWRRSGTYLYKPAMHEVRPPHSLSPLFVCAFRLILRRVCNVLASGCRRAALCIRYA